MGPKLPDPYPGRMIQKLEDTNNSKNREENSPEVHPLHVQPSELTSSFTHQRAYSEPTAFLGNLGEYVFLLIFF